MRCLLVALVAPMRCLVLALAALISGAALASDTETRPTDGDEAAEQLIPTGDPFSRPGVYMTLAGDYAIENFRRQEFADVRDSKRTAGLNARIGYRLDPLAAVEFDTDWLSGFDFVGRDAGIFLFSFNFRFHPLPGRVQPYVIVGVGLIHARGDDIVRETSYMTRFAGGLDIYLWKSLALEVEAGYVLPAGDLKGLDMVPIRAGLMWRF